MPLAVTIPTYQRPEPLRRLLEDLAQQTLQPARVVIVDGDPASGETLQMLEGFAAPTAWQLVYVPSTHGNVSFQRYLCWRAAEGCEVLVYLDDDLRLPDRDFLHRLTEPFGWHNRHVAGVGAQIHMGGVEPAARPGLGSWLVQTFGSGRNTTPGDLTPSGHRVAPLDQGADYVQIRWLRGAVMAFRYAALSRACFPDDMFAVNHIGAGLGIDDTAVSRCAMASGELLLANCTSVEHPDETGSKVMPEDGYAKGYAQSYSRRYLNDRYRYPAPPQLSDRTDLLKSLAYTSLTSWLRALRDPSQAAYARGFTAGSWQALTRPPHAQRLTPTIEWQADADRALAQQKVLSTGAV